MRGLTRNAISASLILVLLTGCAAIREEWDSGIAKRKERARMEALRTAAAAPHAKPPVWNPDAGVGPPKIVINLDEQRAYFYKGGTVIGESNISSGRHGFETPPGTYRVVQKDANHVSSQYNVPMPYFLRFNGGYGMHAGFVPRFRASHGCVRMPGEMAQHFFEAADIGTPVIVKE